MKWLAATLGLAILLSSCSRESAGAQARVQATGSKATDTEAMATDAPNQAEDAQAKAKQVDVVILTMSYVDNCIRTDALVRSTCTRLDNVLPADHRHNCELPAESFETRTAASYGAFKQAYAAEISENGAKISETLASAQAGFNEEFAKDLGDSMSMMDFDSLGRELTGHCSVVEKEWLPGLAQRRQAR